MGTLESNAKEQLTSTKSGNKTSAFGYDDRGFPTLIQTPGIVDMRFEFNVKDNLAWREDGIADYREVFVSIHLRGRNPDEAK